MGGDERGGNGVAVRAMTPDDVDAVVAVVDAANAAADRAAGRQPEERTPPQLRGFRAGMQRFIRRDPEGAWVADDGDGVVGMAEAVRRGGFWGLAMLFVHPEHQSAGVGRQLLDAALRYAEGADVRMIMASPDPRALRRYSLAGLAVHPAVEASGTIDRTAIPVDLPGRDGTIEDLDLVAAVDAGLRGSRSEDVGFILENRGRMEVIDASGGRGFVVHRDRRLLMLGATDEATAMQLLWRFLAAAEERADLWCLTAQQDWAVRVALAAGLTVVGTGPLFISGMALPQGRGSPPAGTSEHEGANEGGRQETARLAQGLDIRAMASRPSVLVSTRFGRRAHVASSTALSPGEVGSGVPVACTHENERAVGQPDHAAPATRRPACPR